MKEVYQTVSKTGKNPRSLRGQIWKEVFKTISKTGKNHEKSKIFACSKDAKKGKSWTLRKIKKTVTEENSEMFACCKDEPSENIPITEMISALLERKRLSAGLLAI